MIAAVIPALALSAVLAAAPAAASPAATSPPEPSKLPDGTIVLELRRARIAGQLGDRDRQRALLDALAAAHPDDPTALAAALVFHRDVEGETEAARSVRGQLVDTLSRPERAVPLPLIQDLARDAKTPDDELLRLASLLATQPGMGAERTARLRLRVDLLDRLKRQDEVLAALEQLTALDPDPLVAFQLIQRYHDAARWEDVLRVTARTDPTKTVFETGWWRLEALSALSRHDELAAEADALLARLRTRSALHADLPPGGGLIIAPTPGSPKADALSPQVATTLFPFVFALLDAGRREPAARLVAELESASPSDENVKRLRVMLFGSPDDRIAFLASAATASIASADPDKIRAEAYQRLLAKDFVTAHGLYRRLQELDPATSSFDSGDWFNYGLASIETEAWTDAETAMTHVLDAGVSKPRAYAHRARARIMLGRTTEGMADAEAALAIEPKSKQAAYAMYLAHHKLGNEAKAQEWLARAQAP